MREKLTGAAYWLVGRWMGVNRDELSDGWDPWDCIVGLGIIFSSVVIVDERLDGVCAWLRDAVIVDVCWSEILPFGTNWAGTGFVDAGGGYWGRNDPMLISAGRAWLIDFGSMRMICSINNSTRHRAASKVENQSCRIVIRISLQPSTASNVNSLIRCVFGRRKSYDDVVSIWMICRRLIQLFICWSIPKLIFPTYSFALS